jgi:hypothetical protein
MARDEIVDETRRIRDEFAKSHDYDVKKITRALKQEETSGGSSRCLSPRRSDGRSGKAEDGLTVDGSKPDPANPTMPSHPCSRRL